MDSKAVRPRNGHADSVGVNLQKWNFNSSLAGQQDSWNCWVQMFAIAIHYKNPLKIEIQISYRSYRQAQGRLFQVKNHHYRDFKFKW